MKNNKAFTLIELVAIVVILGVIMVFALPNITATLERNKKDQMIADAKDMASKTIAYISGGGATYPLDGDNKKYYLKDIDSREEIVKSPFGNNYNRNASYVRIDSIHNNVSNTYKYEYNICLIEEVPSNPYILKSSLSDLSKDNKYTKIGNVGSC